MLTYVSVCRKSPMAKQADIEKEAQMYDRLVMKAETSVHAARQVLVAMSSNQGVSESELCRPPERIRRPNPSTIQQF